MKTTVGTLALIGAILMAGSALAQTAPRGPAPRPGTTPPPAVASVPPGQDQGQTPVIGVGGTGGGPLSNVPPTNDPDDNVAARAPIHTTRSNIKKPSIVMDGARTADPVVPPPITPR